MTDCLFVYGTLRSEFENAYARLLRSGADLTGKAIVRGSIFRVDFYPAYRPHPEGEVHGEVYRLKDADVTLAQLDEYEGDGFERVQVETSYGYAWIYRYRGEPPAETRIASGDFCSK